jgi:hypothetical protein
LDEQIFYIVCAVLAALGVLALLVLIHLVANPPRTYKDITDEYLKYKDDTKLR